LGEDKEEELFRIPHSLCLASSFPSTPTSVSMENPAHATQIQELKTPNKKTINKKDTIDS
jgi:hypothetical protein